MKKVLVLLAVFMLTLTLAACGTDCVECDELPEVPETLMLEDANFDEFLGRPEVQYVDLRNFDDKMNAGYVSGFEMIPFFDYLEGEDVLVRTDGWNFEAAGIMNQAQLENLFDKDAEYIFLMCGSGTRAGFVLDALESIGYTNVMNVGGISNYAGDAKVLGDESFVLDPVADLPEVVDMTNVDMYLGRDDVQYVDLRNFDDKMNAGYISGFEFIPFFDYLEHEDVLVRTDGWNFEAAGIMNQAQLENLFDKDAGAIFLMCGSGTRAGFVLDALESIGYTNVINVGGISSYAGDNKVLGDETFVLNHPATGMYTPGTYFAVDPQTQYTTTIVVGEGGAIEDVVFDAMYNGTTKNALGDAYMLASGVSWKSQADELAAYVVANQGWGEILLDVTDLTGLNYYTTPHHFIEIDHTGTVDAVAGVSIGAEGFVLSWNLAIAQAGGTVIAGVPTSQEWVDAHNSPYDLVDGVYFGDTDGGYTAKVTIENNMIVDVYFDAVRVVASINNNGTPADDTDDFIEYTTFSTKQALGEGYMLASGFTWAEEANELADAIVDAGQWNPAWVIIPGATEDDHDKFDMTDTTTADDVGGVTIGIEGFVEAFEEALAKAQPTT
jgi:rhodanese-related sulfurtransferase/uncharacterized protein with FMN-binding domain